MLARSALHTNFVSCFRQPRLMYFKESFTMKILQLLLVVLLCSTAGFGQIARNFQGNDCAGVPHDLFAELESGKVFVICWVMPCGVCIGPAMTSYNIVKSYQAQYPGRVAMYLSDDFGNTNCTSLNSWANAYNMPPAPFCYKISNPSLDMSDYGALGMPKVVIVGGATHDIYYVGDDVVDATAMQSAIVSALGTTTVDQLSDESFSVAVSPNPASDYATLTVFVRDESPVSLEIVNGLGQVVQRQNLSSLHGGENRHAVDTGQLPSGMYSVMLHSRFGSRTTKLCVVSR